MRQRAGCVAAVGAVEAREGQRRRAAVLEELAYRGQRARGGGRRRALALARREVGALPAAGVGGDKVQQGTGGDGVLLGVQLGVVLACSLQQLAAFGPLVDVSGCSPHPFVAALHALR